MLHEFFILSGIVMPFLPLALYVLTSLGLFCMARNRSVPHAWLAWIPLVRLYAAGSLSDQYQYVVRGKIRYRRRLLLILNLITGLLFLLFLNLVNKFLSEELLESILRFVYTGSFIPDSFWVHSPGALFHACGALALLLPLVLLRQIFYFMALWDIFRSCNQENAVIFLIISILFSFTRPVFLFFSRNLEYGMPPRKAVPFSDSSLGAQGEEPNF